MPTRVSVADAPLAEQAGEGHRRRCPANGDGATGEDAEFRAELHPSGDDDRHAHRRGNDRHGGGQRPRPQADDLRRGDAHADEHDADPQQGARGEGEADDQTVDGSKKIERQADEQRHQRQGRAVVIR